MTHYTLYVGSEAPAQEYTLTADAGSFALSGKAATLTGASVATTAELTGAASTPLGEQAVYTVTLNGIADRLYTVTWYKDGVNAGSDTINVGMTTATYWARWDTSGSKQISFTISPSLTSSGSPVSVAVSANTITTATLWGDSIVKAGHESTFQVNLDGAANTTHTVEFFVGGVSQGTSTILPGQVAASMDIVLPSIDTYSVDFTVTGGLTRAQRPLSVTAEDAATPRLKVRIPTVGYNGRTEMVHVKNIGETDTSITVSADNGCVTTPTGSIAVPAESEIIVGLDFNATGSTTITVSSAAPMDVSSQVISVSTLPTVVAQEPAPGGAYSVETHMVNIHSMLIFEKWFAGNDAYARDQQVSVISGPTAEVRWTRWGKDAGYLVRLSGQVYKLLFDNVEVASYTQGTSASGLTSFTVDTTSIPDGVYKAMIVGADGDYGIPYPINVKNAATYSPPAEIHMALGSYAIQEYVFFAGGPIAGTPTVDLANVPFYYYRMPARFTPTVRQLAARETPFFTSQLTASDLYGTQVAPHRWPPDMNRPNVSQDYGVMSAADSQYYYYYHFFAPVPKQALLDGHRGHAALSYATHIEFATATPGNTGTIGNIYFVDPWRLAKIRSTGEVITLAGYRHRSPPSYWRDASPDVELVGDWSSMPPERRGFKETWGLAWDTRVFRNDTNFVRETPVPGLDNILQPHVQPITAFISDSQNNRIVKIEWPESTSAHSNPRHGVPPVVTEFITGLNDPWDVVYYDGSLFVSERLASTIKEFDASTGAYIRTVLSGPTNLYSVSAAPARQPSLLGGATHATCQAYDIVAPEGLFFQDGWLYYGSWAMDQVKRVNLETGVVQVCCPCNVAQVNNAFFVKIAVSDGTFGPRGSIFYVNWSSGNASFSKTLPEAFAKTGEATWTRWQYYDPDATYGTHPGPPRRYGDGYPSAVGVGYGKLGYSGAHDGFMVLSKKLPTDTVYSYSQWNAGARKWVYHGYWYSHGHHGWGFYGLELPWGVDADIDYYLTVNGHTPPTLSARGWRGTVAEKSYPNGSHVATVSALADDTWLELGMPAPDNQFGRARGRAYTGKMAFAPSLGGAFLYGEGKHDGDIGYIKPDGFYMDDLWFYDVRKHRWICCYPGAKAATLNLEIGATGFEVNSQGETVPVGAQVHGYELNTFDTDRGVFLALPNETPYWPGAIPQRASWYSLGAVPTDGSPWSFNPSTGTWSRTRTGTTAPIKSDGNFVYITGQNKAWYRRSDTNAVSVYDTTANTWTAKTPTGTAPSFGGQAVSCYDPVRNRIYIGGGSSPVTPSGSALWSYDLGTDAWALLTPTGTPPASNNWVTTNVVMVYDTTNNVVLLLRVSAFDGGIPIEVNVYDPVTNAWLPSLTVPTALGNNGQPKNGFYDSTLNAVFIHSAADSGTDGTIWAYRYKA